MQEMHPMGGGRFFAGGGGGGDRRMRPHPNPNHQSLKCPRCESLHTKFCYYNNYNLSQPRHFCKSCRRYWTKGGVLRNVPVGGGCRKSKRSKPRSSATSENLTCASPPTTTVTDTPAALPTAASPQEFKSNSYSTSESSSLTAANTASASINTTEAASTPTENSATDHRLHMHEPKLLVNSESGIPPLEAGLKEQAADSGIFSEIGSFMSLVSSTRETLPSSLGNMTDTEPFRFNPLDRNHLGQPNQGLKFPEITGGSMLDQNVQVDLSDLQNKTANVGSGFGSFLDWHGVGEQGLFDVANHNPVDQVYWTQNYWAEHEHTSLYLP